MDDKEWEVDLKPYEDLNFYHKAMKKLKERTGVKMAHYNRLLDLNIKYQQQIRKLSKKEYRFQKVRDKIKIQAEEIRKLKEENKKWEKAFGKLVIRDLKKAKVVY
jgi:hypothetical protein